MLNEKENHYINLFNAFANGYNLKRKTEEKTEISEETRRKLSKALKGRVFTEDHKRKISETRKNLPDDVKEKLWGSKRIKISDEAREDILNGMHQKDWIEKHPYQPHVYCKIKKRIEKKSIKDLTTQNQEQQR